MRLTRRGRALVAVLGAVALVGGTSAAVSLQDGPTPVVDAASPLPSAAPVRAPLLPHPVEAGPVPTSAGLAALVDAALDEPALRGGLAVSVLDAETGQVLYERAADEPLLPASTAKIATAVAALAALPADLRLSTRVVAGQAPGEVVLVGGGDPTLASPEAERGYPRSAELAELAARTRAALGPAPVTRVLVDESLYTGERLGPGWKPTYVSEGAVAPVGPLMVDGGRVRPDRLARVADPALAAGTAFAALLQPGAEVAVIRGTAPTGARPLGEVFSQPVAALVERMLLRSDNDLAEALARQVALVTGHPASFAGVAEALAGVLGGLLEEAGVDRDAVQLVDGSGLSRKDRLEPAALTRLLARAASGEAPALAPVLSGLPVAGFDGTLARRYRAGPAATAAGEVRAKTGTLNGVSALAGLVRTEDGRLLAFDVTADDVELGATRQAERALDALAARLAACGCR